MTPYQLIRRIVSRWHEHDNTRSAAAIAYYAMFTLAPTLVVATAATGWFIAGKNVQQMIIQRAHDAFGSAGADVATSVLRWCRPRNLPSKHLLLAGSAS